MKKEIFKELYNALIECDQALYNDSLETWLDVYRNAAETENDVMRKKASQRIIIIALAGLERNKRRF